jgi:hypothetical protein
MYVHHVLERGDESHMSSWIEVSVSLGCKKDENEKPEEIFFSSVSFPTAGPNTWIRGRDKQGMCL